MGVLWTDKELRETREKEQAEIERLRRIGLQDHEIVPGRKSRGIW